ncbi:MAG: hypothetical protein P4M04_08905, partial [Acidobacteriota bacterium]|nr:hypothetical protein [Acidobacteriota bacterium]
MKRFVNCVSTMVLIVLLIATWGCSKSQPGTAFAAAPAARAAAGNGTAQEHGKPEHPATPTPPQVVGGGPYSPNVGQTYPNRVLWGLT